LGRLKRKNEYHKFVEGVKAEANTAWARAFQEGDTAKADFYRGVGFAVIVSRRRPLPVTVTRGSYEALGLERGFDLLRAGASAVQEDREVPLIVLPEFRDEDRQREPQGANPGWTVDNPPEHIWDVSISHMGEAVKGFAKGPAECPYESLMRELIPAQVGFGWLAEKGYQSKYSIPLRDALDDWAQGMTLGDNDRASRGYHSTMEVVNALIVAQGG
jgi:hypothetical protein